ncbi:hypothetical protein CspeluHIS016_0802820 [Cutaneotrichosporon spelunceum]|uniref:Uncharacterized protein n=1 Tax=Cutaneotrichosporon spelunceum TaxID=1672016 RepID=A0AAD3YE02_9TREE|nr:hypothetical protein CspeluHIS016_0802820 [Cutaneotrichosporon spelunceum]
MSTLSRTGTAALARASFASTSRASASRTYITIPAPELSSSNGQVDLAVRTFDRMRNMTYAFAIVRAIEAKYGVVLGLDVHKDADTLRPANRMFVTLLKPVELDGEVLFEIPVPKFNPAESTGGVTLAEVQAALGPAQSMEDVEATHGETPRTIKFTVEPRTGRFKQFRYLRYSNRRSARETREDDEIVRALQSFSGGFFGGLSGVDEKFKDLVTETVNPKEKKAAREAEETLRVEVAAEEAQIARELAVQKAKRAAAANAAAAQAVVEEEVVELKHAVTEVVDDKATRLEMLKNRALEAARRQAAADAEARRAAVASKAAAAAAKVQAAKAEPALAAQEKKKEEEESTKSAWRWFEKK